MRAKKNLFVIVNIKFWLAPTGNSGYQDIQRPLLREEGDGAPASSGTQ